MMEYTPNLMDCEICGTLEPRCRLCRDREAYLVENQKEARCFACEEGRRADDPYYLGSPHLDPRGQFEAHIYHQSCLPEGSIPVD